MNLFNTKEVYKNSLYEVQRWVDNTNAYLRMNGVCHIGYQQKQALVGHIDIISNYVRDEYAFYANKLKVIESKMFIALDGYALSYRLNLPVYGELYLIINHLNQEPVNTQFWSNIHPRIIEVAKSQYCDGHFSSAAERAVKEVESRLREKFIELNPQAKVPPHATQLADALLVENGIFNFCDVSTTSGRDFRVGIHDIAKGTVEAYRNPSAHGNINYSKREAFEQIVLASQIMYILDKPQLP